MHTPPEAVDPAGVHPLPVLTLPVVVIGSVAATVVPLSVILESIIEFAPFDFGNLLVVSAVEVVFPEPPPPPPPARAEAMDWIMLTVVVPPDSEDILIRSVVYPAMLVCHVPVLVVEVAAVVELLGVAFSATHVVPPSPDASNWIVFDEALAVTVKVAPPCCGSTPTIRHDAPVVVQVVAAALKDCFCCAFAERQAPRNITIKANLRIFDSPSSCING